jgi:hypothetical protein
MKLSIIISLAIILFSQSGYGQSKDALELEISEKILTDKLVIQSESIEAMIRMGLTREDAERLGSGDIVGNGGGKAEADFKYTYRKLYKFITDCELSYKCFTTDRQKSILRKIKQISLINMNKKDKMIFVDEHKIPGFFRDEHDPQVRVAKTGFDSDSPIFINLDLIYNHSSEPYDIPSIVAILIHEIGHQTGIREHAMLDDLGAIVRNFLNSEKLQSKMTINGNTVNLTAFNFHDDDVYAELNLHYVGYNIELGSRIHSESQCSTKDTNLVGYKIENIHFERSVRRNKKHHVKAKAWITLNCMGTDLSLIKEEKDLYISFELERKFLPPGFINNIGKVSVVVK